MQLPFAQLDLNQLRLLHSLVETGSASRSAEKLGIAPSSVTRGLVKLREQFGPQLFTRTPHGLLPSPLARNMAETIEQMLMTLDDEVTQQQHFDPAAFDGELRLVMDRALLPIVGPSLALQLTHSLPQARLSMLGWSTSAVDKLLTGEFHYGIYQQPLPLPKRICGTKLLTDQMVMVSRHDHPGMSATPVDLRQLLADYPLALMYRPPATSLESSPLEQSLHRLGIDYRTLIKTDDYLILQALLEQRNAVVIGSCQFVASTSPRLESFSLEGVVPEVPSISFYSAYLSGNREQPLYNFLDQQTRQVMQAMQQQTTTKAPANPQN